MELVSEALFRYYEFCTIMLDVAEWRIWEALFEYYEFFTIMLDVAIMEGAN